MLWIFHILLSETHTSLAWRNGQERWNSLRRHLLPPYLYSVGSLGGTCQKARENTLMDLDKIAWLAWHFVQRWKMPSQWVSVVTSLLVKYGIDPKQIDRLEVGSETVIDKSKSIKMFLMQIFEKHGNTDIEGVDSTNVCYGGTAALFNCINWVESSSWDGRHGLAVFTDSADYAEGPAQPTGGAAAIALLVGPDAPIAFESKIRGSHMSHVYDFYKPDLTSEYPVADGKLSPTCYLMALDCCYKQLCTKYEKMEGKQFSLFVAEYFVFHSPYNKLVQKSFARLVFQDFVRNASSIHAAAKEKRAPFASLSSDESYESRDLEKVAKQVAKPPYDAKVQPTTLVPKQVGNMYTASLYATFATFDGKRAILFSYGSGSTATMFSLQLHAGQHPFSLVNIASIMNVEENLKSRHEFPPKKFCEIMKIMEHRYGGKNFVTNKDISLLLSVTFYLKEVDSVSKILCPEGWRKCHCRCQWSLIRQNIQVYNDTNEVGIYVLRLQV